MESLETIIHNILSWKDLCILKKYDEMVMAFDGAIGFRFIIDPQVNKIPGESETRYHAYVGINNGRLKYYLINSLFDTEEQFRDEKEFWKCIIQTEILYKYQNAEPPISNEDADRLIGNWQENYETWISGPINREYGGFRAFTVPDSDVPAETPLIAFFAMSGDAEEDFQADLVFWNLKYREVTPNSETFSDLARPVPPFKKGSFTAADNFYLLTCPVPCQSL